MINLGLRRIRLLSVCSALLGGSRIRWFFQPRRPHWIVGGLLSALSVGIPITVTPGCSSSTQRPACSDTTLAAITAECTAAVVRACKQEGAADYDSCKAREPIEAACDKRIDEWEACR